MSDLRASTRPSDSAATGERSSLAAVSRELLRLERNITQVEEEMRSSIERVPPEHRESARNLVHYVALRQDDLRQLQVDLAQLGLSSLGRSESCVRRSLLETLRRACEALAFRGDESSRRELARLDAACPEAFGWRTAMRWLHAHTRAILGPRPDDRHVSIMVTAPSAEEADKTWMARMLREGMNVLRVNSAYEDAERWRAMIRALAEARRETGKECRVLFDLAGPKIRTGAIAGPRIATWKPAKDKIGRVVVPARVVVRRASAPPRDGAAPTLTMADEAFASARRGDELRFRDARGRRRSLAIGEIGEDELVARAERRAYVLDRARVKLVRRGAKVAGVTIEVGGARASIDVKAGDPLVLTGRRVKGRPPRRDERGAVVRAGVVACTLPDALVKLEVGHRVLFDDGRIEALVERAKKGRDYLLRVVRTQKETAELRAQKGINLPDTATTIPALTEEDRRALAFAARHADAVGLSFVRRSEDVRELHEELDRLGRPGMGVVLKIETRAGFENLPRLLLEGLRWPPLAVMIARGDLAVEVGFERMAELQEEILWLCEASHVPVIWATQVLDTLARSGVPSRAEVTDAAASVAAECVMLNKGPFVGEALHTLSDILRKMEKHHFKKRSLYRKLHVSTFDGG